MGHLSRVGMFDCMFLEREYEFRARHSRPRIVDCGSNASLSPLWFKRQYPESRILAFELSSCPARPFAPRRFCCVMAYACRKSAC